VVSFVVDDQQPAAGLEAAEHPAQDQRLIFRGDDLAAVLAQLAVEGSPLVPGKLARQELVVIGDDQAMRQGLRTRTS
jgi:hypothetical protein